MNPVITTQTMWTLDVDALLASGAMEGPFTRPRPVTNWLYRVWWWYQKRVPA